MIALPMSPLPTTSFPASNEGSVQGRLTSSSPPSTTPPSNEIPSQDSDQIDEEDIPNVNADSDSEEEPESLDDHGRGRVVTLHILSGEFGKEVVKKKDNATVTWTVVDCNNYSSREHLQPPRGELFGLIGGFPIKNGDPDLLWLWLTL